MYIYIILPMSSTSTESFLIATEINKTFFFFKIKKTESFIKLMYRTQDFVVFHNLEQSSNLFLYTYNHEAQ